MSKKKKRSVPVAPPKQEKKMVINMTEVELAKTYHVPGFRTGRHMAEKDRPRKKNWKREYERGKEPGRYRDDISFGSFKWKLLCTCMFLNVYKIVQLEPDDYHNVHDCDSCPVVLLDCGPLNDLAVADSILYKHSRVCEAYKTEDGRHYAGEYCKCVSVNSIVAHLE